MSGRRRLGVLVVVMGMVGLAVLLGGAGRGAADTQSGCAGKPICVSITDQAQASRSLTGSEDHYLADSFRVSNGGTSSTLVNITLTVTWADTGAATTSEYRPAFSDPRCTPTDVAYTLTCTAPSSLKPGEFVDFGPLVFRTATTTAATDTTVSVRAAAKEKATPDKKGGDPPLAFVAVPNATTYEGDADTDISQGGGGISTVLATANTGVQFSKLPVPATTARDLITLTESSITSCPTGYTCLGQKVTTAAPLLAPVNLLITYTGELAGGTKPADIVVLHTRTGDAGPTVIDTACSGDLFSGQPPTSEIPCRRVDITNLPGGIKRVEIDAWDTENGEWTWG